VAKLKFVHVGTSELTNMVCIVGAFLADSYFRNKRKKA